MTCGILIFLRLQVAAANSFLAVVRSYLDTLTCNLRSHTITNVQSNDDKVHFLLDIKIVIKRLPWWIPGNSLFPSKFFFLDLLANAKRLAILDILSR